MIIMNFMIFFTALHLGYLCAVYRKSRITAVN